MFDKDHSFVGVLALAGADWRELYSFEEINAEDFASVLEEERASKFPPYTNMLTVFGKEASSLSIQFVTLEDDVVTSASSIFLICEYGRGLCNGGVSEGEGITLKELVKLHAQSVPSFIELRARDLEEMAKRN